MEWLKGLSLHLQNTETRKKEALVPLDGKRVTMYTCGPTVYGFAHIGNFRTYVFEDLLRRTIKFFGFEIEQAMNLTDVDDKTIKGAIREGKTLDEYTEPYKKAFFDDLKALQIEPVEHYPAATEYIQSMIEMIEQLIEKGVAYTGQDGSVYFSIRKFPRYGCLSHLKLDELETGASERVACDEYDKESACDFVLWKGYDAERDGEIYWESPFGKGRPGWHLECSTMAMKLLGETIDIHVGGVDNIFPHHENEIAQSEACSGERFARHWMHSEHLIVDGKKMSKSLGNFYTLRDLLDKGYTGTEVRYMLLRTHYRTQLNFTEDELKGCRHALERLHGFVRRLREVESGQEDVLLEHVGVLGRTFAEHLADDLNISAAMGALFDFVREGNALLEAGKVTREEATEALEALRKIDGVIGVLSCDEESVPPEIQEMAERRQVARQEKDWGLADEMRDKVAAAGYVIEDTPKGPRVVKK